MAKIKKTITKKKVTSTSNSKSSNKSTESNAVVAEAEIVDSSLFSKKFKDVNKTSDLKKSIHQKSTPRNKVDSKIDGKINSKINSKINVKTNYKTDEEHDTSLEDSESPLDIAAENAEMSYDTHHSSDDDEGTVNESFEDIESIDDIRDNSSKSLAVTEPKSITSMDPLVHYLNEIRKYPLLTKEKELEIAKKYYETKDPESAQVLVRSNLRFVVKVAAEYSKFGAKLIDLIQEGNVGLMHAVREYNPYKGARLITYAVWWIRGYIQEYLMRQYSMVRIGTTQNQRKLFYQLQKEKSQLDSLGQGHNLSELAKKLDIPEDEVMIMAQRMSGRDVSLDKPLDDEGTTSLSDFQKATTEENIDDTLAREELIQILQEKVSELEPSLSEREKIILKERLLNDEPLTLQEIGEKYGITREAVRQMEMRLLKKIKEKMGALS